MFRFGRRRYLFTSSTRSDKGIMASVCSGLSFLAFAMVISEVIKAGGGAGARFGAVGFVSCLFSIAGLVLGIIAVLEKDTYRFFPRFGLILSIITILLWGGILYAGFMLI
ncbi:MAG: DUF6142 family protein [Lachnospiraceae bacterium]|nr:DUF6142 family protein [Lachnospiraceae bacterium]